MHFKLHTRRLLQSVLFFGGGEGGGGFRNINNEKSDTGVTDETIY